MTARAHGVPWAGLASGPGAWAINQQLNYSLVPWVCDSGVQIIPLVALVMAGIAVGGGLLSWRAVRASGGVTGEDPLGGRPRSLLAALGVALALLFALTILTQGAAGLVFDGCER